MSLPIPNFLRRSWMLSRARRALLRGAPEEALELLGDPSLTLSHPADLLRDRVLEVLWKKAAQKRRSGRDGSVARLLELVREEDPERAETWSRRLTGPAGEAPSSRLTANHSTGGPSTAGAPIPPLASDASAAFCASDVPSAAAELVDRLLGEVQGFVRSVASGERRASAVEPRRVNEPLESNANSPAGAEGSDDSAARDERVAPGESEHAPPAHDSPFLAASHAAPPAGPIRFHLAVDDAGEFLVVSGESLTIGHSRGGRADLPFLADLESVHARLVLGESFHGGPIWCLRGEPGLEVSINGEPAGEGERALSDGDEIQLGANVAIRFLLPDSSSSSALLECLRGAECEGATHVLLLGPGRAGRLRIGSKVSRHIPVVEMDPDIVFELTGSTLSVRSDAAITVHPELPGSGARPARFELVAPPPGRLDFMVAVKREKRPPFGFSMRPLDGGDS